MANDRDAFLAAIEAHPCDCDLRAIYADWLEEHGGDMEEIQTQRRWREIMEESRQWIAGLAERLGPSHYDSRDDYVDSYTNHGRSANVRPMTYERLMEYADTWVATDDGGKWGGDYTVQWGAENWRDTMTEEVAQEFWRHWEIVTGRKCRVKSSFFACSC